MRRHPVRFVARLASALLLLAAGALTPAPAAASALYGLLDRGAVYMSPDAGASWSAETTLPTGVAVGLVAGPDAGERTLVTRDGAVWQHADAGWNAVGAIVAGDLCDLTVDAGGTLLALTATGGVYASSDGASWSAAAALPVNDAVAITVDGDGARHVLTRRGSVWRDSGSGFDAVTALPLSDAVSLRARGNSLRVLSATGWVLGSADRGDSWQTLGTLSQVGCVGLSPTTDGWAAVTSTGDVASSADGSSWIWTGTLSQVGVVGLASDWSLATAVGPGGPGAGLVLGAPYPNPASAGATVTLPVRGATAGSLQLELFDMRGRRLVAERLRAGSGDLRWDTPELAAGSYLLRVSDGVGRLGVVRWVVGD